MARLAHIEGVRLEQGARRGFPRPARGRDVRRRCRADFEAQDRARAEHDVGARSHRRPLRQREPGNAGRDGVRADLARRLAGRSAPIKLTFGRTPWAWNQCKDVSGPSGTQFAGYRSCDQRRSRRSQLFVLSHDDTPPACTASAMLSRNVQLRVVVDQNDSASSPTPCRPPSSGARSPRRRERAACFGSRSSHGRRSDDRRGRAGARRPRRLQVRRRCRQHDAARSNRRSSRRNTASTSTSPWVTPTSVASTPRPGTATTKRAVSLALKELAARAEDTGSA